MLFLSSKKLTGLYVLIIGMAILAKTIFPAINNLYLFFILLFIISINFIVVSIRNDRTKRLIIPGVIFLLFAVFMFLYFLLLYKYCTFIKIWPVLGLFPSIALIIYYVISVSKSPAIIIPGIFIGIISLVILMKNFGIMKINFLNFTLILISSMLIIIGLFLIFQKRIEDLNKKRSKLKYKK
jgi:hypothetical protein